MKKKYGSLFTDGRLFGFGIIFLNNESYHKWNESTKNGKHIPNEREKERNCSFVDSFRDNIIFRLLNS